MISQNGKTTLGRLSACDRFLKRGEQMVLLRFAVCVMIPVALCVARIWMYVSIFYCDFLIMYCVAAAIAWKVLDMYIGHKRKSAARMMQLAECELFGLRWNKYLCGEELLPEDVYNSQGRANSFDRYKNRFPEELMSLPVEGSFFQCVHYNVGCYEAKQKHYKKLCLWIAAISIVINIVASALVPGTSFHGFLFYVVLTCAPIVVWINGVVDSDRRGKDQLKMIIAMVSDSEQKSNAREWNDLIQDNMFLYRNGSYLVPRWVGRS